MDWRTRRQALILFIAFVITAVILTGLGFAIFYEPGSCVDNRRNQNEEETDCGGVCAPCAFKHQKAIQVFYSRFVESRPKNYDIVAEVSNPNEKLAANPLAYRVHLFDDRGGEVGRRDGQTYVYPNDQIYIVENNFITERVVVRASIEILNDQTRWEYTDSLHPELAAVNKSYEVVTVDERMLSHVTAELVNREQIGFQNVDVRTALLDQNGNIVGVAKTITKRLGPGETQKIEFIWPEVVGGTVSQIEIEARANGLIRSNLLAP
jgi:hypothetical protein